MKLILRIIAFRRRLKLEDCCELEASVGSIESSRPDWATKEPKSQASPQSPTPSQTHRDQHKWQKGIDLEVSLGYTAKLSQKP